MTPAFQHWTNVFVAICVQAMPFLVLGVVLSGLVAIAIPDSVLARLPQRTAFAVPAAALSGALLPGCECSSVPIAARLTKRGVAEPVALAFLLAAPAINPVVMVATAVAFPNRPSMVVGRFVASALTAMVVGWMWPRVGVAMRSKGTSHEHGAGVAGFLDATLHDFVHAGGYLVVGALTAATLQTVVPRSSLDSVGSNALIGVLVLAVLAIVLSICSEADAFVATGLTQFSYTARLVFLVVGPMVDLKLIALQAGAFGRQFAVRFSALTVLVAVVVGTIVGTVLL